MRLSLEWLRDFVDFDISPEELNLKLTMAGLEVESVEQVEDDTVFEVNVTPNRSDCLSVLGIAREVSAILNLPLKMPEFKVKDNQRACDVSVKILAPDLCFRYAGRAIKGVKISQSPEWMRRRLERAGMRPINNVVDVTNYVLLEIGHPLHAFDMDRIKGKAIRVERAGKGQVIRTIDGVERKPLDDSLLIWDSDEPVAIAGIMGGQYSEVSDKTVNVFLESAYFLPSSIRRTSKALGLQTESSYRFERGTDRESLTVALDRAACLISELAGGEISERVDKYPVLLKREPIVVRSERARRIIGAKINDNEMVDILKRLCMSVSLEGDCLYVLPPSYRNDLESEIDIIEEIARLYGYDKIPVTVPKIPVSVERASGQYSVIANLKDTMTKMGFTECINYSFMNISDLNMLRIPDNDIRRRVVRIKNPLRTEESYLRTTLLPSLIRDLQFNISMGTRHVRLFEIARVFHKLTSSEKELPVEKHYLGAIYYRPNLPELWRDDTPEFFRFKGFIEQMLSCFRLDNLIYVRSSEPFFHPGKSADIVVSEVRIGTFGLLLPEIVDELNIKAARPEIYLCEIDLDSLIPLIPQTGKYSPIPRYPYIERDIAIVVNESVLAASLVVDIRRFPSELIEDVTIFDYYKGPNIPEGKKSLAFTIRYRAKDRTLTDEEVDTVHKALIQYITEKTGGILRG